MPPPSIVSAPGTSLNYEPLGITVPPLSDELMRTASDVIGGHARGKEHPPQC